MNATMNGRPSVVLPSVRDADARAGLVERGEVVDDLLPARQMPVGAGLETEDRRGSRNRRAALSDCGCGCGKQAGREERERKSLFHRGPEEARGFYTFTRASGRSLLLGSRLLAFQLGYPAGSGPPCPSRDYGNRCQTAAAIAMVPRPSVDRRTRRDYLRRIVTPPFVVVARTVAPPAPSVVVNCLSPMRP